MSDLTLPGIAMRLAAYLFIAAVHGFAVAAAAAALGEEGPRQDRRLSLNPLAHLDLVGTASGVLFLVGWIRPVAIDPLALRPGRIGLPIVVAAGCAATLAAAAALRLLRPFILPLLGDTAAAAAFALIEINGELSVWFALVNLAPVPPMTGAHLLAGVAPAGAAKAIARLAPYAGPVVAVLAATGLPTGLLGPLYRTLATLIR